MNHPSTLVQFLQLKNYVCTTSKSWWPANATMKRICKQMMFCLPFYSTT